MWTKIEADILPDVLALCRGAYQRDLILGRQNLSGSTLMGLARDYTSQYKRSQRNLFQRLGDAGFVVREERGPHNRRVLVVERRG